MLPALVQAPLDHAAMPQLSNGAACTALDQARCHSLQGGCPYLCEAKRQYAGEGLLSSPSLATRGRTASVNRCRYQSCLVGHLAGLRLVLVLRELLRRARQSELTGEAKMMRSSFTYGFTLMPVRFTPGRRAGSG